MDPPSPSERSLSPDRSGEWGAWLDGEVDRQFTRMVALRRWMHAQPELSGQEFATSRYLATQLHDPLLEVRLGSSGRGVIVDIAEPANGSFASSELASRLGSARLAIRADIDALAIADAKHVEYRSRTPGVMHACGHDVHSAMLAGALWALCEAARADRLPTALRLRGIFQPAEETCAGAREMMDDRALDGVSAILALHVDPGRPLGTVGQREGVLTANCDELKVEVQGEGGHAARPHLAVDPLAVAVQLVSLAYERIPRVQNSLEPVVVSFTSFHGGETSNVIPDQVHLRGTLRTLSDKSRDASWDELRRIAASLEHMTDAVIRVECGVSSPSVRNDRRLIGLMAQAARNVLGPAGLHPIDDPSMGSEDFAFYLQRVPGAMLRVGCVSEQCGGAGLHTSHFDVDEETLRHGAKILARSAVQWLLDR